MREINQAERFIMAFMHVRLYQYSKVNLQQK